MLIKILFKNCQRNFNNKYFLQLRQLSTLKEKVNVPKSEDLYEPRFEVKRHYPDLQLINVKLKAFDFQMLEKFQSFIHWTAENFGFDVVEWFFYFNFFWENLIFGLRVRCIVSPIFIRIQF
ncbi:unnamed protein product [Meloidogyne enterolobii]|uniref:Uncharacterized protein n=1 Tax=Meloidogyne enterolobii TaxID=390850 RepID=A0ACB0XU42_MELEN